MGVPFLLLSIFSLGSHAIVPPQQVQPTGGSIATPSGDDELTSEGLSVRNDQPTGGSIAISFGDDELTSEGLSVRNDTLFNETLAQEELKFENASAKDRLLLFWPVNGDPRVRRLVIENVRNLRRWRYGKHPRPLFFDLCMVHYDGLRKSWSGPWYDRNVRYSLELNGGLKFWLAKDILLGNLGGLNVDINSYEYIWLLDEDVTFNATDIRKMVDLARESRAQIVGPAFRTRLPSRIMSAGTTRSRRIDRSNSGRVLLAAPETEETGEDWRPRGDIGEDDKSVNGTSDEGGMPPHALGLSTCQVGQAPCKFQMPRQLCKYRYVNFVEVSFPLMKPGAFRAVMNGCPGCMPNRASVWGLDRVWCSVAGQNEPGRNMSCAILDATPVIHENFRTLPKWHQPEVSVNYTDYQSINIQTRKLVRSTIRDLWWQGFPHEYSCVAAEP